MKANFLFFLIIILTSCNTSDKPKKIDYTRFDEKQVLLSAYDLGSHKLDSFAVISIKIPDRFDTFYQFQRYPNIVRGNFRKYRFADSKYSMLKERDGLEYYLQSADSLYQLTISCPTLSYALKDSFPEKFYPKDTALLIGKIDWQELDFDSSKIFFKQYFDQGSHSFLIACYKAPSIYRENEMKLVLLGFTRIRDLQVIINAECDAKDTTDFINNMYKSFLSIRIKEK